MTQFSAHLSAMDNWKQQLGDVSADVTNLIDGAPATSGVTSSHGAIGYPMQTSFDAARSARGGAMVATRAASSQISELLGRAAQAYERGDTAAADGLRAQAQQLEGGSPASAGAAPAAGGGGQAAGQMLSQFGQMAGQMGQQVAQPLQAMSQGLGQIPQQVLQGVQGIVESATGAAGDAGVPDAVAESAGEADPPGRDDRGEEPHPEQLGGRADSTIGPGGQAGAGVTQVRGIRPQNPPT
ncbi:type VII secretion target [Mycobacterium sp. NPDC003449]